MKVIGVIPARYQSSRFPGKPLAEICGKPMIWWVYQQCLKVTEFSLVVVATDDERIKAACDDYGMAVVMTSREHPTGTDRVAEVAQKIDGDLYVNIQGDEPLINPDSIRTIVEYYMSHPDVEVLNTMQVVDDLSDLNKSSVVKVAFNKDHEVIYLSRAPIPYPKGEKGESYYRHMGLYGMTKAALSYFSQTPRGRIERIEDIEMFRFIENHKKVVILPVQGAMVAVDNPEDIGRVEAVMRKESIV